MTRRVTASIAIVGLFALLGFDLSAAPPNPYQAPAVIALGSGVQASGGFCGALPE